MAPSTEQGRLALTTGPRCAPADGTVGGPDAPGRGDGCPASGRDQQKAVLAAGLPPGAPPPGPRMGDTGVSGFLAQTRVVACQGAAHALSRTTGRLRVTAAARASGCSRTP